MLRITKKDQTKVEVFEGVTRYTLACGKDILLAKFVYEKGSRVPPHKHAYEQITTLLKGKQKIIVNDGKKKEEVTVETGDSYVIPANYEHEQISIEESVTIDTWSMSP
ncbi:MAG: cupin domain-containing protein [Candidatus Aminicenantes bacterium]|nr:cupin domain-containing protein [Candidatus Aminicenantes bacterium]